MIALLNSFFMERAFCIPNNDLFSFITQIPVLQHFIMVSSYLNNN